MAGLDSRDDARPVVTHPQAAQARSQIDYGARVPAFGCAVGQQIPATGAAKVIDIFGNDTMTLMPVNVG